MDVTSIGAELYREYEVGAGDVGERQPESILVEQLRNSTVLGCRTCPIFDTTLPDLFTGLASTIISNGGFDSKQSLLVLSDSAEGPGTVIIVDGKTRVELSLHPSVTSRIGDTTSLHCRFLKRELFTHPGRDEICRLISEHVNSITHSHRPTTLGDVARSIKHYCTLDPAASDSVRATRKMDMSSVSKRLTVSEVCKIVSKEKIKVAEKYVSAVVYRLVPERSAAVAEEAPLAGRLPKGPFSPRVIDAVFAEYDKLTPEAAVKGVVHAQLQPYNLMPLISAMGPEGDEGEQLQLTLLGLLATGCGADGVQVRGGVHTAKTAEALKDELISRTIVAVVEEAPEAALAPAASLLGAGAGSDAAARDPGAGSDAAAAAAAAPASSASAHSAEAAALAAGGFDIEQILGDNFWPAESQGFGLGPFEEEPGAGGAGRLDGARGLTPPPWSVGAGARGSGAQVQSSLSRRLGLFRSQTNGGGPIRITLGTPRLTLATHRGAAQPDDSLLASGGGGRGGPSGTVIRRSNRLSFSRLLGGPASLAGLAGSARAPCVRRKRPTPSLEWGDGSDEAREQSTPIGMMSELATELFIPETARGATSSKALFFDMTGGGHWTAPAGVVIGRGGMPMSQLGAFSEESLSAGERRGTIMNWNQDGTEEGVVKVVIPDESNIRHLWPGSTSEPLSVIADKRRLITEAMLPTPGGDDTVVTLHSLMTFAAKGRDHYARYAWARTLTATIDEACREAAGYDGPALTLYGEEWTGIAANLDKIEALRDNVSPALCPEQRAYLLAALDGTAAELGRALAASRERYLESVAEIDEHWGGVAAVVNNFYMKHGSPHIAEAEVVFLDEDGNCVLPGERGAPSLDDLAVAGGEGKSWEGAITSARDAASEGGAASSQGGVFVPGMGGDGGGAVVSAVTVRGSGYLLLSSHSGWKAMGEWRMSATKRPAGAKNDRVSILAELQALADKRGYATKAGMTGVSPKVEFYKAEMHEGYFFALFGKGRTDMVHAILKSGGGDEAAASPCERCNSTDCDHTECRWSSNWRWGRLSREQRQRMMSLHGRIPGFSEECLPDPEFNIGDLLSDFYAANGAVAAR